MKFKSKLTAVLATTLLTLSFSQSIKASADTTTATQSNLYDKINQQFTQAYQTRSAKLVDVITKEVSKLSGTNFHEPVEASLLHLNQFISQYDQTLASVNKAEATHLDVDISAAQAQIAQLPTSEVAHTTAFNDRINAIIAANEQAKKAAALAAQKAAADQAAKEAQAAQEAQREKEKANNPYGLKYTGFDSIDSARALRNSIEQGGNMNINLSLNLQYIGGYGFAKSTWLALCSETATSPTDFSVAHQNLLADTLVRDAFGGDWGNVPKSGGW